MRALLLFLRAVVRHWAALVTGTAATVIAFWWPQLPSRIRSAVEPIPPWFWWGFGLLALFVACFLAWRDEHLARVKAEEAPPSFGIEAAAKLVEAERRIAELEARTLPRRLNAKQKADISTAVRAGGPPPQVYIRFGHHYASPDGLAYSQDLAEAFRAGGWECSGGDGVFDPGLANGINVYRSSRGVQERIIAALRAGGVEARTFDDGDAGDPAMVMIGEARHDSAGAL